MFHRFFRQLLIGGRLSDGQTVGALESPQDLDALDGINAQIGLHIQIQVQHLRRVARPFAHDLEKLLCQLGLIRCSPLCLSRGFQIAGLGLSQLRLLHSNRCLLRASRRLLFC